MLSMACYHCLGRMRCGRCSSDSLCPAQEEEEAAPRSGGVAIDVALGGRDVFSMVGAGSAEVALWDGVLSIRDPSLDSTDITISDGASQVCNRFLRRLPHASSASKRLGQASTMRTESHLSVRLSVP